MGTIYFISKSLPYSTLRCLLLECVYVCCCYIPDKLITVFGCMFLLRIGSGKKTWRTCKINGF